MAVTATKGVLATAVAATGLANKQGQGVIDARLKQGFDTYTTLGTEGVGSTITMGPILPQGALIRDVQIVYGALGGSTTLSVGDTNSATRYQNATVTSSAGKTGTSVVAGINYAVGTNSGDNQIVLTTGGATLTVGLTIQVLITYVFD
jgi:hypothetical protein